MGNSFQKLQAIFGWRRSAAEIVRSRPVYVLSFHELLTIHSLFFNKLAYMGGVRNRPFIVDLSKPHPKPYETSSPLINCPRTNVLRCLPPIINTVTIYLVCRDLSAGPFFKSIAGKRKMLIQIANSS